MRISVIASDHCVDAVPWSLKALKKYWSDCPYVIDVVYNTIEPDMNNYDVLSFRVGVDRGWIPNLNYYLREIRFNGKEKSILLMLEDYITVDVNRELIAIAEKQLKRKDVGMVRLVPTPGPTLPCDYHTELGEIDKKARYSLSLQATMWKVSTLQKVLTNLLKMNARSPWDFELHGSSKLADWGIREKFLGFYRGAIGYQNLYRRGKISKEVEQWMIKNL